MSAIGALPFCRGCAAAASSSAERLPFRSCFAAASLQCLAAARPFPAYLATRPHARCGKASCVLCILCDLVRPPAGRTARSRSRSQLTRVRGARGQLESMNEGDAATSSAAPSLAPLVHSIRRVGAQFTAYRQEDAHDFVQALLDRTHTVLLGDLGGELRFDPATRESSSVYQCAPPPPLPSAAAAL
jgi:hypothetical protein